MQVSDSAARVLSGLLEARTGQQLTADRMWRIGTALSGLLRDHGLASVDELALRLIEPDCGNLANAAVDALLNNETYFFRDRNMFDVLAQTVLPEIASQARRKRHLQIWSVGCSTGQEAISLAMLLSEQRGKMGGVVNRDRRFGRVPSRDRNRAQGHLSAVSGPARAERSADDQSFRGASRGLAG